MQSNGGEGLTNASASSRETGSEQSRGLTDKTLGSAVSVGLDVAYARHQAHGGVTLSRGPALPKRPDDYQTALAEARSILARHITRIVIYWPDHLNRQHAMQ